jgi:hypothetical protein
MRAGRVRCQFGRTLPPASLSSVVRPIDPCHVSSRILFQTLRRTDRCVTSTFSARVHSTGTAFSDLCGSAFETIASESIHRSRRFLPRSRTSSLCVPPHRLASVFQSATAFCAATFFRILKSSWIFAPKTIALHRDGRRYVPFSRIWWILSGYPASLRRRTKKRR